MFDGLELKWSGWATSLAKEAGEMGDEQREELRRCTIAAEFPTDVYREMGRRGWLAPFTPEEYGGLGGGVAEYCVIAEEVGRHGLVSPQIAIQGQRWLLDWGTLEQKDRYLGPIARGEMVFSESISEPGAGSSLKSVTSRAERTPGRGWLLNGRKTHVNLGHQSDVTLVFAHSDEGLSAFLVDTDSPGVQSRQTDPIGLRLIPTADMFFENVAIPPTGLLGELGGGLQTFLTTFNVSRIGNASELLGFSRRALVLAIDYAKDRLVGDSHVADFQGIQWTIADIFTSLYSASLVRNQAAGVFDRGEDPSLATSLAKKVATEAAEYALNEVFALIGSLGLYNTAEFVHLLHDVKVLRVAGGSLEVMRNYVAKRILRSATYGGLA